MPTIRQYTSLLRYMGPGWLLYRAAYTVRRRTGWLRRASPLVRWEQVPAPALHLNPPNVVRPVPMAWGAGCIDEAEAILRGEFRLFSHRQVGAGFPPDWSFDQLSRSNWPQEGAKSAKDSDFRHWSEISDAGEGDIKGVWELSRFPWAFALARAHVRAADSRFAGAFWRLFVDWCEMNPPNTGPNWMCGQEATFRLMAVVFAAETLGVPSEQREGLARFVVATGRRISANLGYALSQKNNHGISECVGLITAALLVPEHAESSGWLARGLRELESQVGELVYEDGGFAQHSLIYHRVLLHDLCWVRSRINLAGQAIPTWLDATGRKALEFLMALVDPETGQGPLYGANDGANVLSLAEAGFLDMRPVVQLTAAVFRGELPLPAGPWDEAAAWLLPDWSKLKRVPWAAPPAKWHAPAAGCFQMTSGRDRLFMRCPENFPHRPGHADMLHVDIWHDGRPVAHDGGSFSYNSRERFSVLSAAAQHNVLTVIATEPMEKFSRFLYLPWPKGTADNNGNGSFRASHNGYEKLGIQWSREVSAGTRGGFVVTDRVAGVTGRQLRWHWRLTDGPWRFNESRDCVKMDASGWRYAVHWRATTAGSSRLMRADGASPHGWWSPHYGTATPACSLLIEVTPADDVELVTEFLSD